MSRRALLALPLLGACSPLRLLDPPARPAGMEEGIAYGPLARQRLDLYRPAPAAAAPPLVVFFYGGAWQTGARRDYRFAGAALARLGAVAVLPDYRLYPETRFPGFVEDAALATRWALDQAGALGADPARVFLAGHSAGAHIALLLALDRRWLGAARGRIAGAIGLAGPYDFLPITRADIIPIFAGTPPADTQPISHVGADAPPLLLLTGAADRVVEPRNTRALAAAARAAGGRAEAVIYPGIDHAGVLLSLAPWFAGRAPVLADIGRFIGLA